MGNITHFAVYVPNRLETAKKIQNSGYEALIAKKDDGNSVYFVKDPDNNLIELKEN